MAIITRRFRIDAGRLVMVPAAAAILLWDLRILARGGRLTALQWAGAVLVCLFYLLIIWCYLRRTRAVATSGSVTAHAAAVAGTLAPFAFPLLPATPAGTGRQLAANLLLVTGTAWSLWSLRSLGRSLSVLAQARAVVERGPYRWVRHPLYTGELVSALGLAVAAGTAAAAAAWLAMCGLQGYRALREEQLLAAALPAYRSYRGRTAALLPGVF
jgi:protein-S-isoprenylcysteine O-methyltransferase Ste14